MYGGTSIIRNAKINRIIKVTGQLALSASREHDDPSYAFYTEKCNVDFHILQLSCFSFSVFFVNFTLLALRRLLTSMLFE